MLALTDDTIAQLELDLTCVQQTKISFDGMLVRQHLDTLLRFALPETVKKKAEEAVALYKHDGRQCYANQDRPKLALLLREIIDELRKSG